MKKFYTFAALAAVALVANAQTAKTESWHVDATNYDALYVQNPDASQASVVTQETANVTMKQVSGPVAGYVDGTTVPLETTYDNGWGGLKTKDLSKDGSVPVFYYSQGKGNPVNIDKVTFEEVMTDGEATGMYRAFWNDSYYAPDGSAGLPANGTYVTLSTKVAGIMKVAVWVNKGNREIYIAKASDAKALPTSEIKVDGYVNGQNWKFENENDPEHNVTTEDDPLNGYPYFQENIAWKMNEDGTDAYVIGQGNQAVWVYMTFNAAAGETYYVFNKNTQVGFGGFDFTYVEGAGIEDVMVNEAAADAPVYNLQGIRVDANAKGILIQNGKKIYRK